MTTSILHVPDISCEPCERAVAGALAALPGVRSVVVDVPGKRVRVTYDEARVSIDRMKEILQEEDYPVAAVTPA